MHIGFLIAGLAAIFVGKIISLKAKGFEEFTLQSPNLGAIEMGEVVDYSQRVMRQVAGYQVAFGEVSHEVRRSNGQGGVHVQVLYTNAYVELFAKEGDAPYRVSNVPRGSDLARARDSLMPPSLELYDARMRLERPSEEDPVEGAHRLVQLARCLSDGERWPAWLARPGADARGRYLLLLKYLNQRPEALAVAKRVVASEVYAGESELRAWAMLVLDDPTGLQEAFIYPELPERLLPRLFEARLRHGVSGFESYISWGLRQDGRLFELALRATEALPVETAAIALAEAYDQNTEHQAEQLRALAERDPQSLSTTTAELAEAYGQSGEHRAELLKALVQCDPAAARDRAFSGLSDPSDALRDQSSRVLAKVLPPEQLTKRLINLIELNDNPALRVAACHALALGGTLEAVWPLRQLQERVPSALRGQIDGVVKKIQARHKGERGRLALSENSAGRLALSED